MIQKNKMEAFERVDEQNFTVQGKKGKKKREGPSLIYEDDSNLHLEFPLIQKFGKLAVSPPVNADDLPKIEKSLQSLRDALQIKGQLEIMQNKAKLLKDESWCQGEVHDKLKASVAELPEEIAKQLDAIKRNRVSWHNDDAGFNVDHEYDEEEIGARSFTKLRPDEERRGRGRGPRESNRGRRDDEERKEDRAPKKKQEKFNAAKMDFPTMNN